MTHPKWLNEATSGLDDKLLQRIIEAEAELEWLREASADELLTMACNALSLRPFPPDFFPGMSAIELGDQPRSELLQRLEPQFEPGTATASDLADQIQLCRAFANPRIVSDYISANVTATVKMFPSSAADLKVGRNLGDVLDPFLLAANFELLSKQNMQRTIESSAAHKILMKIEDMVGHLHQNVIGMMRGNFRVPEPRGRGGKEKMDIQLNPFPGADVGQVPIPENPESLRLFQVKSKTGSAKGGDGKRLGDQLLLLEQTYDATTFYVSIVGNTLKGHRSRAAVERESPNTAVLVGEAALFELTGSRVGGELLLRTYQRSFRRAAMMAGYDFEEVIAEMCAVFEGEAETAGEDFLTAWLHGAIGGRPSDQDSRL